MNNLRVWAARVDRTVASLVLALAALAALALAVWGQSGYAPYLTHDALGEVRFDTSAALVVVVLAGWTLMSTAMMLPSSLPLVASLRRVSGGRADGTRPALLLAGYLAAWLLFGIAVNLADLALHRFATAGTFLERHPWLASSLVLALAGSYQLSPMKRRVLAQFHSPHCFLDAHWDGNAPPRRAVWLGLRYGRLCVGCCWPLMLLLFAVGHGSILLMSLLGAVMAVEKHTAWGRELRTPLGIALLAASAALVLV